MTENMKNVLVESATKILDKKKKTNKPWITDDILNLCDKRQERKKKSKKDTETLGQYKATNKIIRTKVKQAQEKWLNEQCNIIENGLKKENNKVAFKTLKTLTQPNSP
jgi:hypothetical protein